MACDTRAVRRKWGRTVLQTSAASRLPGPCQTERGTPRAQPLHSELRGAPERKKALLMAKGSVPTMTPEK